MELVGDFFGISDLSSLPVGEAWRDDPWLFRMIFFTVLVELLEFMIALREITGPRGYFCGTIS